MRATLYYPRQGQASRLVRLTLTPETDAERIALLGLEQECQDSEAKGQRPVLVVTHDLAGDGGLLLQIVCAV